ncbi:hypothetical protein GCM10018987_56920 [Streptomyces cremeus]
MAVGKGHCDQAGKPGCIFGHGSDDSLRGSPADARAGQREILSGRETSVELRSGFLFVRAEFPGIQNQQGPRDSRTGKLNRRTEVSCQSAPGTVLRAGPGLSHLLAQDVVSVTRTS